MTQRSSPWREPIVWLMVALVGSVLIGSIVMLKLALSGGPMDVVRDEVERTGEIQHADLGPDANAAAAGLAAVVRIDREHGLVEVFPAGGDFDHAQTLRLALHHPIRASDDLTLELTPFDAGWSSKAKPALDHDWLLQLEPLGDARWRLRGRLLRDELAARVAPAVAVDTP